MSIKMGYTESLIEDLNKDEQALDEPRHFARELQRLVINIIDATEREDRVVWINLTDRLYHELQSADILPRVQWHWLSSGPRSLVTFIAPEGLPNGRFIARLATHFGAWVANRAQPELGLCHLEDCDRVYVKSRSDAQYCSSGHAKTAWTRRHRAQMKSDSI